MAMATMLRSAVGKMGWTLVLRRLSRVMALPPQLDGTSDRGVTSQPFVLLEFDQNRDDDKSNEIGFEYPSFTYGGSMELMAVPKRKVSPHKRGIRNGPKALKPIPVIIRCNLFAYTVLHMLMYAANIYFWRHYRVNYPFLFGFKRGTELSYREVFLLSTGLSVLGSASLLANLHLDMDSSTHGYKTITEIVPLGLVTFVLMITFCPFNIIYRSSRFFFIKCIFRCICASLYPVTLPVLFLADQLTSQAFRSFELYICYYGLGEYSRRQNKCHRHGVYNTFYFIVAVLSFWLHFLQCIRRFYEDKDAMHGYNGLKYFSTIVAVLIRTAFELKKRMTWMVLALVSSAVAVTINTYWDVVVDWGLLQRQSRNRLLRDKLLISRKSVYFAAMVLNIVLHSFHKMTVTTISCLEIIRRGIRSFFRLENEHLNNVGKYHAFKSVPLPFSYIETEDDGDDDDDKDD